MQFAYAYMAAHHALEATTTPPSRYPDIFPVTNVLASFSIFGLSWVVSLWKLLRLAVGLVGFDVVSVRER